jgi:hypothetical protein
MSASGFPGKRVAAIRAGIKMIGLSKWSISRALNITIVAMLFLSPWRKLMRRFALMTLSFA